MRKRLTGFAILFALLSLIAVAGVAQQPRSGGAQRSATAPDLKIKYRTTTAGQAIESVTMIKGARERAEMHVAYGMDTVNITQCDLRRTIQLSDKTRKYIVTPIEVGDTTATPASSAAVSNISEPSGRGGLITYVSTATDTGERKEMFGFTARHVKTSMSIESSPDACTQVNQRMETDGWYIDLSFGFECNLGRTQTMANRPIPRGGCQDRVSFRQQGTAKTGYPLIETVTMYGPDGKVVFTTAKEVLELSREPLPASLFDVPSGYEETRNVQELYGTPSMDAMAEAAKSRPSGEDAKSNGSNVSSVKTPGTIRIGVVPINNRTDRQVSTGSLRERLIGEIQGSGIEAIALNAITPADAETEARAKQCDFILYTDIAALKTSAAKKLGGMFGRAAGVSGIDKTESKVEFKLFAVSESSARLQSTTSAKEEGDEVSAGLAIDQEAKMVTAEVRKKGRG